jgi:hypothetical protein
MRVESVVVTIAIDRGTSWSAALEGPESIARCCHTGIFEAFGHLLECHGFTTFEQGDEQQRERFGLAMVPDSLQRGDLYTKCSAVRVAH